MTTNQVDRTIVTETPPGDAGQQTVRTGGLGRARDQRIAGALLLIAGGMILMAIITAEALYPGAYSTGANAISDPGGTEPPNSVILQPSGTIPMAILGIGALGVGVFPGDTGTPHALFAMATFISGGVAAITSARVVAGPFRGLCVALGLIALLTLASYMVMGDAGPMAALGLGGIERWIVYPIVLWATAFGGYLAGRAERQPRLDRR